jgi:iron complex outermembrane recepter protein
MNMFQKRPITLAVHAAIAFAAAQSAIAETAPGAADQAAVEEIVVTGSRIQRANEVTSSPVVQLDAEQFQFTGSPRVEDTVRSLPQVYTDQDSGQSIEADGTATVQLRNLGDIRTLVLIDGKRLPPNFNGGASVQTGPDLNSIPIALVDRVEVLTGGASATYGSDAVAGVVNFTMKDNFEGISFDVSRGGAHHDNNGNITSNRMEEAGLKAPSGDISDGEIDNMSLLIGGNLAEGRGNVTAYATYIDIKGVTQSERDYSACALGGGRAACAGSATNATGTFYAPTFYFNMVNSQFVPADAANLYNFASPSYLQRPDKRYTLGAFAHYDVIPDHVTAYTQLMFMNDQSDAQFAPAGLFFDFAVPIRCDNPLLTAQEVTAMGCTAPTDVFSPYIGRRNVEGGPRTADIKHDNYRGVFGLKGNIDSVWRYDASYQYAEVDNNIHNTNYVNTANISKALDVVNDPTLGIVCQSVVDGSDPSCVPWNIFQTGGVTPAATKYIASTYYETSKTDQTVLTGYVQGNLGEYGVKSPWADSGIDIILGAERRQENLDYAPDDASQRGDIGGLAAALVPVNGGYTVKEAFTEASVPLIQGKRFIQDLTLDLGYRYSDYTTDVNTDTYKYAGTWTIDNQIKLRASYQRAVRAANIVELYGPVTGNLFAMGNDPCHKAAAGDALSVAGYTFAQCARTGVTQAVWDTGGPGNSPADQYNTLIGGNAALDPESSDTYSYGIILKPNFLENVTLTVDYYDIKVEKAITSVNGETTLTACIDGNDAACTGIHRNHAAGDSLWLGNASPTNGVDAIYINSGFFQVKGIDVELRAGWDLGNRWGSLDIDDQLAYVDSWKQQELPGTAVESCQGKYGESCETPLPQYRNRFTATWTTPWNVSVNLAWRFSDGVKMVAGAADPVNIHAVNYFDLAAIYNVTDYATVRAGVNNLLDTAPPITDNGVTARNNGNVYPGAYDAMGQYWFIGATFHM